MNPGEIIKKKRLELKLTLEDVGRAVGVGKSTVKKWEDGYIANMRRDKIAKLASVLDISPICLIDQENITLSTTNLSEHEQKLITAYRNQPDIQPPVDRLLGIETPLRLIPTAPAHEQAKVVAFGGGKETITPSGTYDELKAALREIDENQEDQNDE